MKRKLLAMSLSLVVASSLVLSGCSSKNESVATSTKVEEAVEGTEKATEKEEVVKSTETEKAEEIKVEAETETEKVVESTESSSEVKESTSGKAKETTSTSGSKSGSTSVSNTSVSNTSGGTSSSTETAHVHNWTPVTTIVHHDAQTHQEDQGSYITVVDQEAYDSEEPIMERDTYCITCYNRGNIVRLHGQEEVNNHIDYHYDIGDSSCQYACKSLQVGTQMVHHDAITHQEWQSNIVTVTDKLAYDEEVITGYVCSECGATK